MNFSFWDTPHPWQGAIYWPSGTLEIPIRAPKQKIFTPKQACFPMPLSMRVKTSNTLSKLVYEPFSLLDPPHLWGGAMYQPSGTHGTPISGPKQHYLPLKQTCFP